MIAGYLQQNCFAVSQKHPEAFCDAGMTTACEPAYTSQYCRQIIFIKHLSGLTRAIDENPQVGYARCVGEDFETIFRVFPSSVSDKVIRIFNTRANRCARLFKRTLRNPVLPLAGSSTPRVQ
jgi:hypothetical protein